MSTALARQENATVDLPKMRRCQQSPWWEAGERAPHCGRAGLAKRIRSRSKSCNQRQPPRTASSPPVRSASVISKPTRRCCASASHCAASRWHRSETPIELPSTSWGTLARNGVRPIAKTAARCSNSFLRRNCPTIETRAIEPPKPPCLTRPWRRFHRDQRKWWARRDSNPQPSGYEPPALTIELQAPPRLD